MSDELRQKRDEAIADMVMECIRSGFHATNPPPDGHWTLRFWRFGLELWSPVRKHEQDVIADFLKRSGQWLTNEATHKAALAEAFEKGALWMLEKHELGELSESDKPTKSSIDGEGRL